MRIASKLLSTVLFRNEAGLLKMALRFLPSFLSMVLLPQLAGCSLSMARPVAFSVIDAETKQPIAGAKLDACYYVLLDFGLIFFGWGPLEGVTDRDGKVTLHIDPHHPAVRTKAAAKGYQEENRSATNFQGRLLPRKQQQWGNEYVLEMYAEPAATLDLEFSEGFRGLVLVRFSPPNPLAHRAGQRHFRYVVPANGVVDVKESALLERLGNFDRVHAVLADGSRPPTVSAGDHGSEKRAEPPGEIALRYISPTREPDEWGHTWIYVLGTRKEAEEVSRRLWPENGEFDERALKAMMDLR